MSAYDDVRQANGMHSEADPLWLMGGVFFELANKPLAEDSEERIEERTEESACDEFDLFLQEFAGGSPEFPQLQISR